MRASVKPKLTGAIVLVALLALPAAANATLAYTKGAAKPRVYVAEDNGARARQIGLGRSPRVSPDGELVVYERETNGSVEMRLYSLAVGKSQRLLNPWRGSSTFAWSPDSRMIAAVRGGPTGPGTLLLIDLEGGARTKVATGYFNGVSFSPESEAIVYGKSRSEALPPKSDLYRYEFGAFDLGTPAPVAISHDHNSSAPLWGPTGRIVFVRGIGARWRRYAPKNELFLTEESGWPVTRLTATTVDPLAQGLTPVAWSESGRQLLAEFGGQDQSYAVAVDANTGAERALTDDPEAGFQGAALSPDGKTVLGSTGLGFGGNPHPKVVTVPFASGPQKVLVSGAYSPS